jgi:hypothetical protein
VREIKELSARSAEQAHDWALWCALTTEPDAEVHLGVTGDPEALLIPGLTGSRKLCSSQA